MKTQRNTSLCINTNFSLGVKPVWTEEDPQLCGAPPSGRKAEHNCVSGAEQHQENENENCPSLFPSNFSMGPRTNSDPKCRIYAKSRDQRSGHRTSMPFIMPKKSTNNMPEHL